MAHFKVLFDFLHEGKWFAPGDSIELPEDVAAQKIRDGHLAARDDAERRAPALATETDARSEQAAKTPAQTMALGGVVGSSAERHITLPELVTAGEKVAHTEHGKAQ